MKHNNKPSKGRKSIHGEVYGDILTEGVIATMLDVVKNLLLKIMSKGELKNIDRALAMLKRLKKFGVKKLGGESIDTTIRGLKLYRQNLINSDDADDDMHSKDFSEFMKKLTHIKKESSENREEIMKKNALKHKYSLAKVFLERKGDTASDEEDESEVDSDLVLDLSDLSSDAELSSPENEGEDELWLGLSDEEILAGLLDDVSNYGQHDPYLKN